MLSANGGCFLDIFCRQFVSKAVLGARPQLGGCGITAKESQWSEVMSLWVCKTAWKRNFPGSRKVKKSVGSTVLQKFGVCYQLGQQETNSNANARDRLLFEGFSSGFKKKFFSKAVLGHKASLGHNQLEVATEASGLQ